MSTNLYIDESGSMTKNYSVYKPFFVISIIKVKNEKILARNLKRFISSNFKTLKKIDKNNKMFENNKFKELKGSELNSALKLKFIQSICKNDCLEIFYIKLSNSKVDDNFFDNKARAFNYLLKLFFIHNIRNKNFSKDEVLNLQIDERNIKTKSKHQLAEYLNTELLLSEKLLKNQLNVTYFDSANNKFIQVADVFSNIFFSDCMTNNYKKIIEQLTKDKYIKDIFLFPLTKKNDKQNVDNDFCI